VKRSVWDENANEPAKSDPGVLAALPAPTSERIGFETGAMPSLLWRE
jgi:hypothetical protein